jgi:hemoglobin
MSEAVVQLSEAGISALVDEFYARARRDPLLGPVFESEVVNWMHHLQVIADFWSHVLLGTDRYRGTPYPVHVRLPVKLEHFDRWLALFEAAAPEFLPPTAAETACARARMMAASFRAGLFGPGGPLA